MRHRDGLKMDPGHDRPLRQNRPEGTRSADSNTTGNYLPRLLSQGGVFLATLSAVAATKFCVGAYYTNPKYDCHREFDLNQMCFLSEAWQFDSQDLVGEETSGVPRANSSPQIRKFRCLMEWVQWNHP